MNKYKPRSFLLNRLAFDQITSYIELALTLALALAKLGQRKLLFLVNILFIKFERVSVIGTAHPTPFPTSQPILPQE